MPEIKPKPIKFDLIRADSPEGEWIYSTIRDYVARYHPHLAEAVIEPAWMIGNKHDKDGKLELGRCVRVPERYQIRLDLDFVIEINAEAWAEMPQPQRLHLIDHELCHAMPALDKEGEQRVDGHGRLIWRLRKHEIEEFFDPVRRHGTTMAAVRALVEAALTKEPQLALEFADGSAAGASRDVDPAVARSIRDLVSGVGDRIESMTISHMEGGKELSSVTIDKEGAEAIRKNVRRMARERVN